MNKEDVKKLDEMTAEEVTITVQELSPEKMEQVNGGRVGFTPRNNGVTERSDTGASGGWRPKIFSDDGVKQSGTGASGSW